MAEKKKKHQVRNALIRHRVILLALFGALTWLAVSHYHVSLWYVLAAGVLMGLVFGKVFCRWMCPLGLMMEILTSLSGEGKVTQMYQYHKIGCPIAWASGLLNRFSLFRIRRDDATCTSCGICDKQCYIVAMEPQRYSLYKPKQERPGNSYTCSKCLSCVASCKNGSLKYTINK